MSLRSGSIRRLSFAVLLCGVAGLLAWLALSGERRTAGPRSAILITIDTLRADHLSGYGYARNTSPNLDAFFARGTRFMNALSTAPTTAPSHTAMLTGLYPGFTSVWKLNGNMPLSSDAVTLAEIARDGGLRTAAVVSNAVLTRSLGLHQGFETYDDDMRDVELNRPWAEQRADHAAAKVLAKLAELRGERFFLWAQFQDPHGPYAPPDEWLHAFAGADIDGDRKELPLRADQSGYQSIPQYQVFRDERRVDEYARRYDGEIAYLDRTLQQLFDWLEETGLLETTLVVITSDHGEAFGEDGFYFAHGHSAALDQLHVPFAFIGPGVPAAATRLRPVSNISTFCTIIEALDLGATPACSPGMSMWAALTAGEEPHGRPWFAGSITQWAILQPEIFFRRDAMPADSPIFALSGDKDTGARYVPLGEQVVRMDGKETDIDINATRALLHQFVADAEAARERFAARRIGPATLSPKHAEALRALGYLGQK